MLRTPAVLVGVALAGCYRQPVAAPPAPPTVRTVANPYAAASADPLGFLPLDSEVVGVVDVKQVRGSAAWKLFEPMLLAKAQPVLGQFQTACGFDPLRATRRISIGMHHLDAPQPSGVIVVKGIERAATMACFERARIADPKGSTLTGDIVTLQDPGDQHATVFSFADATTLVVLVGPGSSAAALAAVLARGVPLRDSPAFLDLAGRVGLDHTAWLVVNGNVKTFQKAAMLGFVPRAVTVSLDLKGGVSTVGRIRLDTAAQATQVAGLAQGQVNAIASMIEEIVITNDDVDVVVQVRMTNDQFQTFVGLFGGLLGP